MKRIRLMTTTPNRSCRFCFRRPARPKTKLTVGKALGLTDTIEGLRYVRARPRVFALLMVKPAWGLGGGILTLLAVFGAKIFPVGRTAAAGVGVLYAARGIGTAAGPVFARMFGDAWMRNKSRNLGEQRASIDTDGCEQIIDALG